MAKKNTWTDETGLEIPVSRITKAEKTREREAAKIIKSAEKIHGLLANFKKDLADVCHRVWLETLQEAGVETSGKGNHTWYNFDRSIKIERSVSDRIDFDDALISAAKEKFDEFLEANTATVDQFIRALIMDAFTTHRGQLDPKRIMNLIKHKSKISAKKYPNYHEAVDLIEKSIRRPSSRTYFRVFNRDASGNYRSIDLNFSSIPIQDEDDK